MHAPQRIRPYFYPKNYVVAGYPGEACRVNGNAYNNSTVIYHSREREKDINTNNHAGDYQSSEKATTIVNPSSTFWNCRVIL